MSTGVQSNRLKKTFCFLISGKAGVGKSFTASILLDILGIKGYKAGKFPFAAGVKSTATYMGWNGDKDQKGRRLLQTIGQAGRDYDEDIWARASFNTIEKSVGYPFDAVIMDDWRFPNELEFVYTLPLYKPVTIRILADEREILKGTPEYNDISETSLDNHPFMYAFYNSENGTDFLRNQLSFMLDEQIKRNS